MSNLLNGQMEVCSAEQKKRSWRLDCLWANYEATEGAFFACFFGLNKDIKNRNLGSTASEIVQFKEGELSRCSFFLCFFFFLLDVKEKKTKSL